MVFDVLAWGASVIVGFVMGVVYEKSKLITNLIGWGTVRHKLAEKLAKENEPEEKEKIL